MSEQESICVQRATSEIVPDEQRVRDWVLAALEQDRAGAEITVRIVDTEEGAQLNRTYRHKDYATNVLSFPYDAPPGVDVGVMGDLAICAPVVAREAREQGKELAAHWAHMIVHGVLHLRGYDHLREDEALRMEALETEILKALGFADPYRAADAAHTVC